MRRILAVAYKEYLHLVRDKRTIYLAFFIPIVVIMLIGHAINFDVNHIRLGVYDQCKNSESRKLIEKIVQSSYFNIIENIQNESEIMPLIEHGKVAMILVIPEDYHKKIIKGMKSPVQILVDASDNFTASIVNSYINPIIQNLSNEQIESTLNRIGKTNLIKTVPIETKNRIYFNPNLKSRYTIVPALIAFIMMVISTFLIAMTIAKEWENGTIEQLFASPIKGYELILGKFLLYFILMLIQCLILGLFVHYYFEVPFKSDWGSFMIICVLFIIGVVSFALLISIVSKSLLVALQVASLSSLFPSLLFSGLIYPVKSMPQVLQPFSQILPATYFIECIRELFLKGTPLEFLLKQILILLGIGILVLIIAHKKFKKRMTS